MKSEENGFWAVQIQLSWIFKREQCLYRLLCRRGQIIKCSQHPSVLLLIERYHCVLVTLENQASSFSFCTGSALEKASFEVKALDEPAFLCPDRQMEIPLTKAYSFLVFFFSFCFCIGADEKQMQNPACSSSTCEPGAPAPNTSASLKPVKIHGCSSQMCWGKQAGRSHLFSATVEHLALSTMIFWWRTANMPTYWEHLCWSRGNFLYLAKNCPFCGSPSSQFIGSL